MLFCLLLFQIPFCKAQNIHLKHPDPEFVKGFKDSSYRIIIENPDSLSVLEHQYAYLLHFYPNMLFKSIRVKFVNSRHPVRIKPQFRSIFKAPEYRHYRVFYSNRTACTMDSVILNNLSFNAQLGFISNQMSCIEDLSTGGFFNFLYWYFRNWSRKGRKKIYQNAEYRSIEVGLGYQVMAYNSEFFESLQIDNWKSTKGYNTYMKHYRNLPMKNVLIQNLITDMPVYMSNNYK